MSVRGSLGRRVPRALRALARWPAFSFAAVLTVPLGIAIFSVVYCNNT